MFPNIGPPQIYGSLILILVVLINTIVGLPAGSVVLAGPTGVGSAGVGTQVVPGIVTVSPGVTPVH